MRTKRLLPFLVPVVILAAVEVYPLIWKATPGMTVSEFEGFRVSYVPADETGARAVARALAASRDRVMAALEPGELRPVAVYVYHARKDMQARRYGAVSRLFSLDWWIGDNTKDAVLIVNPGPPGAPGHDHIVTAAVHEFVHVVTDRLDPRTSKWLKEGLACYVAGQAPSASFAGEAGPPAFALLAASNPVAFAKAGGYQHSFLYVEFLAGRYGWPSVRDLLLRGEDYEAVLGKSRRAVYEEWIAAVFPKS